MAEMSGFQALARGLGNTDSVRGVLSLILLIDWISAIGQKPIVLEDLGKTDRSSFRPRTDVWLL